MTSIALAPGGAPRAGEQRAGAQPVRLGRGVAGCLRLVLLAAVGAADPAELAQAGVAAPGYRGGLGLLPRT